MLAIVRFDPPADRDDFITRGNAALAAFAACTGYRAGWLACSTDEPQTWVLCTVWVCVGSYRRALSAYDVKIHATPFMYDARDEVSGFEPVLETVGSTVVERHSDLAPDAGSTAIGDFGPRPDRNR